MPLYAHNKKGVLYRGEYRPASLYHGETKIAGWNWLDGEPSTPKWEEKMGTIITYADTYADVVHGTVYGKSEQKATVQGKNLFDKGRAGAVIAGYPDWNQTFQTTHPDRRTIVLPCSASTTYTIQKKVGAQFRAAWAGVYPSHGSSISGIKESATTAITITTGEAAKYLMVWVHSSADTDALEIILGSVQIELGSTATPYEPFVPNSPSPDYPSPIHHAGSCDLVSRNSDGSKESRITLPVLRGLPNGVRDTLEYIGGEMWRHTQRVGVKVFDGTEVFLQGSIGVNAVFTTVISGMVAGWYQYLICTHFKLRQAWPATEADRNTIITNSSAEGQIGFVGPHAAEQTITTIADFKALLAAQFAAGTPVAALYRRIEPAITDLPLGELQSWPHYTQVEQMQYPGGVLADMQLRARVIDRTL